VNADELVARALRAHPAVVAGDNTLVAAKAKVADADARGVADVTLGLGYAYAPAPYTGYAYVPAPYAGAGVVVNSRTGRSCRIEPNGHEWCWTP